MSPPQHLPWRPGRCPRCGGKVKAGSFDVCSPCRIERLPDGLRAVLEEIETSKSLVGRGAA